MAPGLCCSDGTERQSHQRLDLRRILPVVEQDGLAVCPSRTEGQDVLLEFGDTGSLPREIFLQHLSAMRDAHHQPAQTDIVLFKAVGLALPLPLRAEEAIKCL